MLVSSSFTKLLEDTLKFDCTYSYFRSVDLKKYAASLLKRDSIYWIGDPKVYPQQIFRFYPQFCKSYFRQYDSLPVRKLAEIDLAKDMGNALDELDSTTVSRNYHPLVAMVRPWGREKSFWFPLLCFLPTTECWTRKMRLIYSVYYRR